MNNHQELLLEQLQGTASSVMQIIADLRAGDVGALQRLQHQVLELKAESIRLEAVFESPIYLGG